MNLSQPLNYINCAAASDGGSLCLILSNNEGEFSLILDRQINSRTHNQLFIGNRLLMFNEEKVLLSSLEKLLKAGEFDDLEAGLINEFIDL